MNQTREFTSSIDPNKTLLIDNENRYIIYEKSKLPIEYISTENIGTPNVLSKIADIPVAGREISKIIKYRTEGRDLNIHFLYNGLSYKFSHIQFSNYKFI
jgi:hypothetical protein